VVPLNRDGDNNTEAQIFFMIFFLPRKQGDNFKRILGYLMDE